MTNALIRKVDIPFMFQVVEWNRQIKICDELITEGSTYLNAYRHVLLKRLLRLQLKEYRCD
jgi:hypothetical protein